MLPQKNKNKVFILLGTPRKGPKTWSWDPFLGVHLSVGERCISSSPFFLCNVLPTGPGRSAAFCAVGSPYLLNRDSDSSMLLLGFFGTQKTIPRSYPSWWGMTGDTLGGPKDP